MGERGGGPRQRGCASGECVQQAATAPCRGWRKAHNTGSGGVRRRVARAHVGGMHDGGRVRGAADARWRRGWCDDGAHLDGREVWASLCRLLSARCIAAGSCRRRRRAAGLLRLPQAPAAQQRVDVWPGRLRRLLRRRRLRRLLCRRLHRRWRCGCLLRLLALLLLLLPPPSGPLGREGDALVVQVRRRLRQQRAHSEPSKGLDELLRGPLAPEVPFLLLLLLLVGVRADRRAVSAAAGLLFDDALRRACAWSRLLLLPDFPAHGGGCKCADAGTQARQGVRRRASAARLESGGGSRGYGARQTAAVAALFSLPGALHGRIPQLHHVHLRTRAPPTTAGRAATTAREFFHRRGWPPAPAMRVIVVGAGVVGASVSSQLAQRGAAITVLDAAAAPAQGATGKSWAWLNANYKRPRHYRDLNLRSMELWRQQHGAVARFPGCLMLHDERPDPRDPEYPVQPVPAEQLLQLEPALDPAVAAAATHARLFPLEGWCDPEQATRRFLDDARAHGARVLFGRRVEQLSANGGPGAAITVAASASGDGGAPAAPGAPQQQQLLEADAVVLAAGVGSPVLAAQLGFTLPLLHKPAVVVLTRPLPPGLLQRMVVTDRVFMLQRDDGRVLVGETHPDDANTDASAAAGARILAAAAAAVPALRGVKAETVSVGLRPFPADGYPVLGWLPGCSNVYVAVTHSGLTLAPLVGKLVAEEVLAALGGSGGDGEAAAGAAELLAPYRPGRRFADRTRQQTRAGQRR